MNRANSDFNRAASKDCSLLYLFVHFSVIFA
jgi:hypothetical protein